MAGVTMIAYGVVFVLLLGEIDLSIGYLSGIAAVTAATMQLADGRNYPGWLAILIGLAVVAVIGTAQGTIVAKIGVPSFVVTLAGLLIWQGVILQVLELRGVIIIETNWINDAATYYFSANVGWLIAAIITGLYALAELGGAIGQRRAGLSVRPWLPIAKLVARRRRLLRRRRDLQPRDEAGRMCPGHAAHGELQSVAGASARSAPDADLPRRAHVPRQAHDVRAPRLRRRRQCGGRPPLGHQRRAHPHPRLHDLRDHGRRRRDGARCAAPVGEPAARGRDAAPRLDLGRRHRRRQPVRRTREVRGALLGSLVIATVANGLNIGSYSTGTIYIVTGVILLLAVTLDSVARRLQERSGR